MTLVDFVEIFYCVGALVILLGVVGMLILDKLTTKFDGKDEE